MKKLPHKFIAFIQLLNTRLLRTSIFSVVLICNCLPSGFAFKPKTHIYLALQSIKSILEGRKEIVIDGNVYPIHYDVFIAIKTYPDYYLGGVIGPDGFPDLTFGQAKIHPDLKCSYETDRNGECNATSTWSYEWLAHIFEMANREHGTAKLQASAFAYGFLTHAAGDMWAHTFVNQFAGGNWPEDLTIPASQAIAMRHVLVEGVIGKYTPGIKTQVQRLGGLNAPIDFVYKYLIVDPMANRHADGTLIGFALSLQEKLKELRGSQEPSVSSPSSYLEYHYLNCWINEIDKGLKEWPRISIKVATELFINEDANAVWNPHLKNFKDNYLNKMILGPNPAELISSITNIPVEIIDPTAVLGNLTRVIHNRVSHLIEPLSEIMRAEKNYFFKKYIGLTLDEFKNLMTDPERLMVSTSNNEIGANLFPAGTLQKIKNQMNTNSGFFNNSSFAPAANTINMGSLILMSGPGLDSILYRYNVGPIYTNEFYHQPEKKKNVMLGFVRSLDGNHQWRNNAPPLPATQPEYSFSNGMPIWQDCRAREKFFKVIFNDWSVDNIKAIDNQPEPCLVISNLPPVTITYEIQGAIFHEETYYTSQCRIVGLVVRLTNHQKKEQKYSIYVTNDPGPDFHPCVDGTNRRVVILPRAPLYFHEVKEGKLNSTGKTSTRDSVKFLLPNCGSGFFNFKVYVVEQLYNPTDPILWNNNNISPNAVENLEQPVNSFFAFNLSIQSENCSILPPCNSSTSYQSNSSLVVPGGSITIPIVVEPCLGSGCVSIICDADRDSVNDSRDNCPVTMNTNQADSDQNGIGDVCEPPPSLVRLSTDQWLRGIIPDYRYFEIIEKLKVFNPPLPGNLLVPTSLKNLRETNGPLQNLRAVKNDNQYKEAIRVFYSGIRFSSDSIRVIKANLLKQRNRRIISIEMSSKKGGMLLLYIPNFNYGSTRQPSALEISIDRRRINNAARQGGQFETKLLIPVPAGSKQVQISSF